MVQKGGRSWWFVLFILYLNGTAACAVLLSYREAPGGGRSPEVHRHGHFALALTAKKQKKKQKPKEMKIMCVRANNVMVSAQSKKNHPFSTEGETLRL